LVFSRHDRRCGYINCTQRFILAALLQQQALSGDSAVGCITLDNHDDDPPNWHRSRVVRSNGAGTHGQQLRSISAFQCQYQETDPRHAQLWLCKPC
jgi:hypothetical protein